jgi:hypothetical protein
MIQLIDHMLVKVPQRLLKWSLFASGLGFFVLLFVTLVLVIGLPTAVLLIIFSIGSLALLRPVARRLQMTLKANRARELMDKARASYTVETFTHWSQYPVMPKTRKKIDAAQDAKPGQEITLGRIDSDGRVLCLFGDLPGMVSSNADQFIKQSRYRLDIVLLDGLVLVRKDFCGNRVGFLCEYYNLALLYGIANVPAVYRAEETQFILYKNLVFGRTLRDVLVDAGAEILLAQTKNDPNLEKLDQTARITAVWERAKPFLTDSFSEEFIYFLEEQVKKVHACGLAKLSLTYGNIMVDFNHGFPWLIDFENTLTFRFLFNPLFIYWRAQDREKYFKLYGRSL